MLDEYADTVKETTASINTANAIVSHTKANPWKCKSENPLGLIPGQLTDSFHSLCKAIGVNEPHKLMHDRSAGLFELISDNNPKPSYQLLHT